MVVSQGLGALKTFALRVTLNAGVAPLFQPLPDAWCVDSRVWPNDYSCPRGIVAVNPPCEERAFPVSPRSWDGTISTMGEGIASSTGGEELMDELTRMSVEADAPTNSGRRRVGRRVRAWRTG